MTNHLTPGELADQLQMEQQEVIGKCVQMGIPIFHGRIDGPSSSRRCAASAPGDATRSAARRAALIDFPAMEGGEPNRRRLRTCCPLPAEMYGSHPAVRFKEGDAWVDRSFAGLDIGPSRCRWA